MSTATQVRSLLPYMAGLTTGAFFLYTGLFTHTGTTRAHDIEESEVARKTMLQRHATLRSLGVDQSHMHLMVHEPMRRRLSQKN
mmetsp:Transcript_19569/g.25333  ORF Transcript_19569/g.25333 Transcript_19569/m.25333 type:complete len:84 (-) Transcript_19569:103-354(-)